MHDLAVIIVTWNVRDLALDALRSLYADLDSSGLSATVYVVDNNSSDGTVDAVRAAFPAAHVIASAENLGFVRGNNAAINLLAADPPRAVYLLNPDTITQAGATRALFDALMRDPSLGLVGAGLHYGDGSFQHSAFAFPGLRQTWIEFFPVPGRLIESRFNGRYPRALYAAGDPFAVDFVLGATMLLRYEVVAQTGGFDEAFFMYCEEIDWAWRIRQAGWRVACVPAAPVIHLGGQSSAQVRAQATLYLWQSRLRLFARLHPAWKQRALRWIITLGMTRLAARAHDPALRDVYLTIRRLARDHTGAA